MYDFCVIGGGIVGLATAMSLLERRPDASVVVLEKEHGLAHHQSGHNSGVIHSGIYYEPGSLKATLCRAGAQATKDFCAAHDIPIRQLGKLLVATNARELGRLEGLVERAARNTVIAHPLNRDELREREPAVTGLGALLVPATASVDYRKICTAMQQEVHSAGGRVELGVAVTAITETAAEVVVGADHRAWVARRLIVCGGLQADRLARLAGIDTAVRIVPFRGEYYQLPAQRRDLVDHLIYPIPDPALPFLGVHLTPMADGRVTVGPNAVLGLSREGYRKGSVNAADVRDIVTFAGFWSLARQHVRTGARELRNSAFKRGFLHAARTYCPELQLDDLQPFEAGIRAQAVSRDGTLLHDFAVEDTARTLHVLNAPSPAATAAIPIGRHIAERALRQSG